MNRRPATSLRPKKYSPHGMSSPRCSGQIQEAELDAPDQVRSLKDAVAAAATANGVDIGRFDERD